MTESRTKLAKLFTSCWEDPVLKRRFMNDPKAVLSQFGLDVPASMDVNVVENTDHCVHITMPAPPSSTAHVSDEDLGNAAGSGPCKHWATGVLCTYV